MLQIIAKIYGKNIEIEADDIVKVDRSLNSDVLRKEIGYIPRQWNYLITEMYNDFLESDFYRSKKEKYEKTNKFYQLSSFSYF